jgi:hypothetical protein
MSEYRKGEIAVRVRHSASKSQTSCDAQSAYLSLLRSLLERHNNHLTFLRGEQATSRSSNKTSGMTNSSGISPLCTVRKQDATEETQARLFETSTIAAAKGAGTKSPSDIKYYNGNHQLHIDRPAVIQISQVRYKMVIDLLRS